MPIAARGRAAAGGGSAAVLGLRVMAMMLGVFFIVMGAGKAAWFTDSSVLAQRLQGWLADAPPAVRWYIETLAMPGVPVFARLVPLAEVSAGLALVLGFWSRLAASLAFVMVLNFHFATGSLYSWEFLRDGTGLPVLGGLLALAIGAARLPFSVSKT